ncbi:hypothetical protein SI65_09487 [Aspergillus cristatus]|uniref:Uncharacterized protein n=1 Tax=Aspergillus cristatus TaxID=573508 RepID=A0A1E3B230_ASPCR|nr:hypothetical protein SI65_09487 [Aspergillus cristatus]
MDHSRNVPLYNRQRSYRVFQVKRGEWIKEDLSSRPWVDGIDYSQGVNCLRGTWDETASAMIITFEEWAAKGIKVVFDVKNLPDDRWVVYEGHGRVLSRRLVEGMGVQVEADIGPGEEVDFVIVKEASFLF